MKKSSIQLLLMVVFVMIVIAASVGVIIWRTQSSNKIKVLVVLPTVNNPFWRDVELGALEAEAQLDKTEVKVNIRAGAADDDSEAQIQILKDYLLTDSFDTLVIGPSSATAIVPTLAEVSRKGIPIIVIDSRLDPGAMKQHGVTIASFIGSNNKQGGRLAADVMELKLDKREAFILIVGGNPVHETAIAREEGFKEAAPSQWHLITKQANWDRDKAKELMETYLQGKLPDGVFCASDKMAMGVIAALEKTRLPNNRWPVIVGFDATEDGVAAVRDHRMWATMKQDALEMGRAGVRLSVEFYKKSPGQPRERVLDVKVVKQ